jgi:hypothetical protein
LHPTGTGSLADTGDFISGKNGRVALKSWIPVWLSSSKLFEVVPVLNDTGEAGISLSSGSVTGERRNERMASIAVNSCSSMRAGGVPVTINRSSSILEDLESGGIAGMQEVP